MAASDNIPVGSMWKTHRAGRVYVFVVMRRAWDYISVFWLVGHDDLRFLYHWPQLGSDRLTQGYVRECCEMVSDGS